MFKYLSAVCPLLIIIPYFGTELLYPVSFSFLFAVLSMKKEPGMLAGVAFFVNALFLLIGILLLLLSIFWMIGGGP